MENKKEKKNYNTPKVELIKVDDTDLILTSAGNGDVGRGHGHGGGCDHKPGHGNARTFSAGHNSGC